MLSVLAADGKVVRGRPRGSWISSQYRWYPAMGWLDGGIAELPAAEARAELGRHWLTSFGPGTTADLVTACLYVALRKGIISLPPQFPWSRQAGNVAAPS